MADRHHVTREHLHHLLEQIPDDNLNAVHDVLAYHRDNMGLLCQEILRLQGLLRQTSDLASRRARPRPAMRTDAA